VHSRLKSILLIVTCGVIVIGLLSSCAKESEEDVAAGPGPRAAIPTKWPPPPEPADTPEEPDAAEPGPAPEAAAPDVAAGEVAIGGSAPEVEASEWINTDEGLSLAGLQGEVVLVEFWATWCPPCRDSVPHLNEIYEENKDKGLHVIGFTREDRATVEAFMEEIPIAYPVGLESDSGDDYGVTGIPHAYLVGGDGAILWEGHPAQPDMESAIADALG